MDAQAPALVAGSASRALAEAVARGLGTRPLGAEVEHFPDGELQVRLLEAVQGRPVAVLLSTGAPVGERLLELALLGDACWRAGAASLVAVVPYFGFARQDRRTREGEPLGAWVASQVLALGRYARVVAVDLHAPAAVENALPLPLEQLSAVPRLAEALRPSVRADSVVVSPDLGATRLAERYAQLLGLPMAVVHKLRVSGTEVAVQGVVGEVRGRRPILVDDMVSTGGTLVAAARALAERGCLPELTVAATHLLLAGDASERLRAAPVKRLVGTDSLALARAPTLPVEVVSLAPDLAAVLRRLAGPARPQ